MSTTVETLRSAANFQARVERQLEKLSPPVRELVLAGLKDMIAKYEAQRG